METSLSVRNDAVLKSARRWIIAAYVCQLINWVLNYFKIFFLLSGLGFIFVLLPLFVLAFIKLKAHSNPIIQRAAKILLVAILIQLIFPFLFDSYFFANWEIALFPVYVVFVILQFYPFIMAYTYLNKCSAVKYNHPEVSILYLLAFVGSTFAVCRPLYHCLLAAFANKYMEVSHFLLLYSMLTPFIYLGVLVFSIVCWKRLLATPSDIPAMEEETPKISFVPSRVEVGYLISLLLFAALVYAAVYYLRYNY